MEGVEMTVTKRTLEICKQAIVILNTKQPEV